MNEPKNPPAFPLAVHSDMDWPGMTLRDWFAGQALAGLMANANMPFAPDYAEVEPEQIGVAAYDIAEAMLAARGAA
jgi:hypothetical protein